MSLPNSSKVTFCKRGVCYSWNDWVLTGSGVDIGV
ncbi:MAG: hypothetical protein ACJAX4_000743 [Clostridium sp.]|jgi:hypothetical protein